MAGAIDDQVHFREPGLTHKADLTTESRAAVAGGITSFMEMPNTVPNALTQELLQDKYDRAAEVSVANYSFFMGASNDNLSEVLKTDPKRVCGIKVFMGSSTGNMLVDERSTLEGIFKEAPMLVATHCEDEATIRKNLADFKARYGEDVPMDQHPIIRSAEACYISSSMAAELASKYNTRLHILHISTAKELELFRNDIPLAEKRITAEACIHHLWFTDADYAEKGSRIKWNPAVKTAADRAAIREALISGRIDVVATDHAPHTWEEKQQTYFNAPSGAPLVEHAVVAMLEMVHQGVIELTDVPRLMAHQVAEAFQLKDRGYVREGYQADLVMIQPRNPWTVRDEEVRYKCKWSPLNGTQFTSRIASTWVNGHQVFDGKVVDESERGQRLTFDR
jgi:dihydroorotase